MKNKHLIQAIEFAKRQGCIVTRKHVDGMTVVSVTNKDGTQSAAKVYKTGSSNPQARYIKEMAKRLTLVKRGVIIASRDGRVYFLIEKAKELYAWHAESKTWKLWIAVCDHEPGYVSWCLDGYATYNASVKVEKLKDSLYYA